jgi:hypothetical protein
LKSVRWIRLQKSSTERYSLDSTTGELQVVRDLSLFVPQGLFVRPLSAMSRTLTRLFVTLSGTATRPLCDSIEMRQTTAGSADIGTCHGTSGMARVRCTARRAPPCTRSRCRKPITPCESNLHLRSERSRSTLRGCPLDEFAAGTLGLSAQCATVRRFRPPAAWA